MGLAKKLLLTVIFLGIISHLSMDDNKKLKSKTNNEIDKPIIKEMNLNEYDIIKMEFSEAESSVPVNDAQFEHEIIKLTIDSISLIKYIYKEEKLLSKKKLESYSHPNKDTFSKIPEKYFKPEKFEALNFYPENDGSLIIVKLYTKNNLEINWSISYNEKYLPNDLKFIPNLITESKKKLKML